MAKRKPDGPVTRRPLAAPTSATKNHFAKKSWLLALALMLITFVAYTPVWHAGFIWDDDSHILQNPGITAPDGLRAIWSSFVLPVYYPLTFTVFRLIHQLWDANPLPYHAVTLALHAVNAVLLLFALRRLNVRAAWVVAALWAVHPVNVESVAWCTELKNTLSGAWFLVSILCFLRHEREPKPKWFACALVAFGAALLSKSSTVILPPVLLLCAWWQRGRVGRTDVVRTLPFFALSLAASVVAVWAQVGERLGEGAARDWSLQFPERLIIAGKDVWFYASKIVWPFDLMFIYPRWSHTTCVLTEWLPLAGAVIAGIVLWRFRRAAWARAAAFALGYFVVALLPVLALFDQYFYGYSFVADHFQYLAGVGVIALVAGAAATLCANAGQRGKIIATAGTLVLILALGTLTWKQACVYHDIESLWRDTLAKNPSCWMAHNNLGEALIRLGRLPEAMRHEEEALRIKPDDAVAHYNMGLALFRLGKVQEAIGHYEQALRKKPNFAEAHNNLGDALFRLGRLPEAMEHVEQALRIKPDNAEAHNNMGGALLQLGRSQEAIGHYEQALRLKPDFAVAHCNLGIALEKVGNVPEAIKHYEQALLLKPDFTQAQNALKRLQAGQ